MLISARFGFIKYSPLVETKTSVPTNFGKDNKAYVKMLGKTMADFRKESEEPAKDSIKMRLVLEAVCKDAKLEAPAKDVDEKIAELANSSRVDNAAYFTNKWLVNEIVKHLPLFDGKTIRILEPSVGVGNFIPLILKKYDNCSLDVKFCNNFGQNRYFLKKCGIHNK